MSGSGPWSWSCLGEAPDSGQNQSCSAGVCTACSGSVSSNVTGTTVSGSIGGCSVEGTVSWKETDSLNSNSGSSAQLQWSAPFSFSQTANSPDTQPAPYCQTCYKTVQSISNAQLNLTSIAPAVARGHFPCFSQHPSFQLRPRYG